jgi:hypothetical protein
MSRTAVIVLRAPATGIGEDPERTYGNSLLPRTATASTLGSATKEDEMTPVFHDPLPSALPWARLGADVVLECTGKFRAREGAAGHLHALSRAEAHQPPSGSTLPER